MAPSSDGVGSPDRRKLLKAGAAMGAVGILTLVPHASLAQTPAASDPPMSIDDSLTVLMGQGVVRPFNGVSFVYAPRNSSVKIVKAAPAGEVFLIREDRITVSQDHALELSASIDGEQVLVDPDVVQARYDRSFRLVPSSLYAIRSQMDLTVSNRTSKTSYFSIMQSGMRISGQHWDELMSELGAGAGS